MLSNMELNIDTETLHEQMKYVYVNTTSEKYNKRITFFGLHFVSISYVSQSQAIIK